MIALAGSGLAWSSQAANAANPPVWNHIWKPGTALPKIGPNETLSAWPVQSVLARVKVGHQVPTVMIGHTNSAGKCIQTATAKQITGVTNPATGMVNVTAAPHHERHGFGVVQLSAGVPYIHARARAVLHPVCLCEVLRSVRDHPAELLQRQSVRVGGDKMQHPKKIPAARFCVLETTPASSP